MLLLVEVAAIGLDGKGSDSGGQEVDGVCVRARLVRSGPGRTVVGMEWVSGHEEVGIGACGLPLQAEHVVCDD